MNACLPVVALLLGTLACAASGQSDSDPELRDLERSFAEEIHAKQKPITEKYIASLEKLVADLERTDASAAQAVRDRIAELRPRTGDLSPAAEIFPTETTGTDALDDGRAGAPESLPGDIRPSLAEATLAGGVSLIENGQILAGFTAPESSARWQVGGISPGRYEVILAYSCAADVDAGGEIAIVAGEDSSRVRIRPGGTWDTVRSRRIGRIKVADDAPLDLSITTVSAAGAPGVFALRSVILRPLTK